MKDTNPKNIFSFPFDSYNKKQGEFPPAKKIYHFPPMQDRPIPEVYGIIDNDLARDNLENDITAADLQDL